MHNKISGNSGPHDRIAVIQRRVPWIIGASEKAVSEQCWKVERRRHRLPVITVIGKDFSGHLLKLLPFFLPHQTQALRLILYFPDDDLLPKLLLQRLARLALR